MTSSFPLRHTSSFAVSNIIGRICHVFLLLFLLSGIAFCQPAQPRPRYARSSPPPSRDEIFVEAVTQNKEGPWHRLRGHARLETSEILLLADEMDYNEDTGYAEARGNAYLRRFETGEELWAEKVEYSVRELTGKFYNVRGSAPPRIESRPGVLTTTNPYYFEGRWAERLKEKYILHEGFITNCKLPNPWWVLRGPKFEVVPNQRALAFHSVFWLRKIPLFYTPLFYKSLERMPRKSGLLTPNLGNSSRRGKMLGVGYYWAINRSYDAMYRAQYFTQRGIAHHVDVRGKPTAGSDFNWILYGVNDRGLKLESGERRKEGGVMFSFDGRSELPWGFQARADVNYLSSLTFRQAFTESFNEAIFSEVHSVGFLTRHWSTYGLNLVFQRLENFQSLQPDDTIVIRKLPQAEFSSRDREVWTRGIPVWVSLDSSVGLVRRKQPLFQTRQFLERADLEPRVMTALRWKDFHLIPSFSLRETHWGESQAGGRIVGQNIGRHSREFSLALEAPALARVFNGPRWFADKVKHVIEPRASFRYVSGVGDVFNRLVLFDETELLTDTKQAEFSITNRLYVKRKGIVSEVASWELFQQAYFDPTFGGAVVEGRRNVALSSIHLTSYAFLDRPRDYSPVISVVRMSPMPGFGVEWRADYDPLRGKVVNSGMTADARWSKYFVSVGHNSVRSAPELSPGANQFRGLIGIGNPNGRGWNGAFSAIYDFRFGVMQFATTQVSYNTECCGWSIQYRRFSFGTRNENQFRIAFAIANIGSFGTLKKQERLF